MPYYFASLGYRFFIIVTCHILHQIRQARWWEDMYILTSWRVLQQISTATTLYLEFHVQLHSIEIKMHYRLVVEIGAGCLCRWADLLCTIVSWCQQRNFIFILCTFVLHWLSNLNHTKIIYLMCSHICLYIGRFFT